MRLATLAVAAAAAFAFHASPAPARLNAMLDSVKASSVSHGFASDLQYARSEAIRRAARIVLCKSADGESCAERGAWAQGWIVFHDANGDGLRTREEALLVREHAFSRSLRFAGSLNAVRSVEFGPTGAARLLGASLDVGTLTVCREAYASGEARRVVLKVGKSPEVWRETVTGCA